MTDLLTSTIRNQVMLEGLKTSEAQKFAEYLKEMDESLRVQLSKQEISNISRARLEKLLESTDSMLAEIFDRYANRLKMDIFEIAQYQSEFQEKAIYNALTSNGAAVELASVGVAQLKAAVFSYPLATRDINGGKMLGDFIDGINTDEHGFIKQWTNDERSRITGAIRQGFYEGQTTSQIIQKIRGTRKNKFNDGILQITSRSAEAIVRTAVQHCSSVARMETLKANSDIVDKYRIVATLDRKTTTQCRALDGRIFEIGKGPLPPFHIRCRTTFTPVLSGEFAYLSEGRTRASADGYVDADTNYYGWLKNQPEEFQKAIIGPTRAKLLRDGGLTSERFSELNLDKNFQPLTLDEMRKLEPLAFEKAGL